MKKKLLIIAVILIASYLLIGFIYDSLGFKSNDENQEVEYVDLIGDFDRKLLTKPPYSSWYKENFENYNIDIETANEIKNIITNKIKIKVIMGTWCSDSRENVPAFFKVMDYINFRKRNIEIIGLDVDKKNPNEDEIKYNIINVPTFIFLENGEEINRIVEITIESLEKDILKILNRSGYQNAYYGF